MGARRGVQLQERLLWLCGIPSTTGTEQRLADELQAAFTAMRLAEPVRRYGNSLVVPVTRGRGPKVLLVAQLDAADAGQPYQPREESGWILGSGSADPKSGLCVAIDLCERRLPLRADLTLVLHARGEAGSEGSELRFVVHREPELMRADFALVLKPTDNRLELGCGGSTHALLAFAGRSAHSAFPGAGVNAIHKFARVAEKLAAAEPIADQVDGLTWFEVLQATAAQGGKPLQSVVPNELEVYVHHSFGPSTSLHDSQEKLIALMDRLGAVRFESLSAAALPKREHPLLCALQESGSLNIGAHQPWSEVSRFTAQGVATANFGPGAARSAHSRNEGTELKSLEAASAILAGWLTTLPG